MLAPMKRPSVEDIHKAACQREEAGYLDPESGLMVLTEHFLRSRGHCCRRGCRHCPYRAEERRQRALVAGGRRP